MPDGSNIITDSNMPVLSSAAALYRTTINRLAIEIRTQDDPTYSSDIGWQITESDWAAASANALDLLRKAVAGEQEDSPFRFPFGGYGRLVSFFQVCDFPDRSIRIQEQEVEIVSV